MNKRKDRWMTTMKAAVIHEAGGPEVLKIERLPIPTPQSGEVLIRVKAFGLNRSELFTREGNSTAATPNSPACPRHRCRSLRPKSPGKRSEPSRRCCKRLGARCSSRFVLKKA